ncbi:hypothetical protein NADFUDRAFT_50931 [Nadsonia fulvescens var. elongata DSM 6958]|uniref:Altered inheritance of mitochondria protein 23, mitochondrial n=1 Tax=Nadsonia fulvescens var. elongata DSM 6958 TaxID=857566 RepID=A0A1E3PLD4_9ASCO|nr:hypothetical protein NADFUDRAFT_50931 [Nadsonia fulvescens var. elongata DSM 6958]
MLKLNTLSVSFFKGSRYGIGLPFLSSRKSKTVTDLLFRSSNYSCNNKCAATFHTSAAFLNAPVKTLKNDHSQVFKLTNEKIGKVIPEDGFVAYINSAGKFKPRAPFQTILAGLDTSKNCLIVASYRDGIPMVREIALDSPVAKSRGLASAENVPLPDAVAEELTTPITPETSSKTEKEDRKLKAKLEKQAIKWKGNNKETPKRHIISWSIAAADLQGKKRKDIENALLKGFKVEIFIGDKKDIMLNRDLRSKTKLEPLERERRELLVDQIKSISEEIGTISKKPSGNIYSKYSLVISPTAPDYFKNA